jgi:Zn finger protein HypA/HybF involved in hydrogenase expression
MDNIVGNTMSNAAKETIETIMEACENDPSIVMDEVHNTGICLSCGATKEDVEPDAQGYTCDVCGENTVDGFEMAVIKVL